MNQTISSSDASTAFAASSTQDTAHPQPDVCSNCGTHLSGLFCHQCGQSSKSMIKFFGEVIKELLDDTLGYDSRLKHSIFPLIFKPAKLSLEYIKGRRFYYVLPFRLYLFTSLFLILFIKSMAHSGVNFDNRVIIEDDSQQVLEQISVPENISNAEAIDLVDNEIGEEINRNISEAIKNKGVQRDKDQQKLATSGGSTDADTSSQSDTKNPKLNLSVNLEWDNKTERFVGLDEMEPGMIKNFLQAVEPKIKQWKKNPRPLVDNIIETLPYMMFILLPIFAIVLKLFYIFSKRYYTEHLILLLHNHSFVYLMIIIRMLSGDIEIYLKSIDFWLAQGASYFFSTLSIFSLIWIFVYIFMAIKNFYQQSWMVTSLKTISISFIYLNMLLIGFIFSFIAGAYQA